MDDGFDPLAVPLQLLAGLTPLMIAKRWKRDDIVEWLSSQKLCFTSSADAPKRERSSVPLLERAELVSVSDLLKPIPSSLHERIASGTPEDAAVAKQELRKLQKVNNQTVVRAEAKRHASRL